MVSPSFEVDTETLGASPVQETPNTIIVAEEILCCAKLALMIHFLYHDSSIFVVYRLVVDGVMTEAFFGENLIARSSGDHLGRFLELFLIGWNGVLDHGLIGGGVLLVFHDSDGTGEHKSCKLDHAFN